MSDKKTIYGASDMRPDVVPLKESSYSDSSGAAMKPKVDMYSKDKKSGFNHSSRLKAESSDPLRPDSDFNKLRKETTDTFNETQRLKTKVSKLENHIKKQDNVINDLSREIQDIKNGLRILGLGR